MKKSLLLFCLSIALYSFTTQAQIRKVPAAVTEAFAKNYPNASKVEWRDKLSHFTATFQNEGKPMLAQFESDGTWILSETTFTIAEIPAEVKDGFDKSKYANWGIKKVVLVQDNDSKDNEVYYRLLVQKTNLNKKYLSFSAKGRLMKETLTL